MSTPIRDQYSGHVISVDQSETALVITTPFVSPPPLRLAQEAFSTECKSCHDHRMEYRPPIGQDRSRDLNTDL